MLLYVLVYYTPDYIFGWLVLLFNYDVYDISRFQFHDLVYLIYKTITLITRPINKMYAISLFIAIEFFLQFNQKYGLYKTV